MTASDANPSTITPKFFEAYTRLVPETDLVTTMVEQLNDELKGLHSISEQEGLTVHSPYTWTINQVVGHMIDTEIVFAYRALRFSRLDATPLPGFDQDQYIAQGNDNQRSLSDLVEQFILARQANIAMFRGLPATAWSYSGSASNMIWTVEDLARSIIGHFRHHHRILKIRLG